MLNYLHHSKNILTKGLIILHFHHVLHPIAMEGRVQAITHYVSVVGYYLIFTL